ncbi:TIGR02646 family protein [Geomonas sp. Red69]|uniref:retron system putative HNH endonuclease n=1 Tax=Geomonas diazotrophica TaxID=2843197 RepID=UPI001C107CB7|nr:retron system putative HNH endonuclease [Geomonas diazotrophica]MBU5635906.1 TIGR02646 family protein [Geomonas diazotrophica]
MRRIVKTHAPQQLTKWRNDNKDLNHAYEDMLGTEAHQALKDKLLEEQGGICAYTGRAIDAASSHVEHLKPQNQCVGSEDVEYRNVVACFPADGGDTAFGYGAPVKAGWWNEALFVSPLSEECERRFRFTWSGHVYPNPGDHQGATETIKILGLDKEGLRQLRKSRIDGFFGFGARTRAKPLSIADARTALARVDEFNGNGRLQEFCFVLKQLLPKFIEQGGE